MRRWQLAGVLGCVLFAVGASACAGMKEVKDPKGIITLEVPETWKVNVGETVFSAWASEEFSSISLFFDRRARTHLDLQECAKLWAEFARYQAKKDTERGHPATWEQESLQPVRIGGLDGLLLRARTRIPNLVGREDVYLILTATEEIRLRFHGGEKEMDSGQGTIQAIVASVRFPGLAAPPPQPMPGPLPAPAPDPFPMPPGPLPAPTPAQDRIVGSWLVRNEQVEVRAEFRADGRYSRSVRTAQQTVGDTGTYRAAQGILELTPDGGQAIQLRYQMPDPNRLVVTDAQGAGTEMVRQAGAPAPGPYPVPTPGPPNPVPGPTPAALRELQDPQGVFTLSLPANYAVQERPFQNGVSEYEAIDPRGVVDIIIHRGPRVVQDLNQLTAGYAALSRANDPNWTETSRTPVQVSGFPSLRLAAAGRRRGNGTQEVAFLTLTPTHQVTVEVEWTTESTDQVRGVIQSILASWRVGAGQAQPAPQPTPGPVPGAMKQVQDANGAFAFSVPGDWRVQQQAGSATACDPTGQAFVQVVSGPKQAQSLDQFAQWAVAMWRQSVPQWQAVGQQAVQIGGRQALQIRATGSPNNAAMMADYFLVLGDQTQVIVTVFCPQAAFPQRMAAFQQIVQTLQVR